MLSFLLNDANFWFSCALGAVLTLLVLELAGMFFGLSLLSLVDDPAEADFDTTSGIELTSWLALDRLPLMVWLVVLLTSFGITGYLLNFLSLSFLTTYFNPWLVIGLAILIALLMTSQCGGFIARLLPKQETSATTTEDLVGTVGYITLGVARPSNPAEGKFTDSFGQPHYLLVEPIETNEQFSQGEQVLLLKKQARSWLATRYIPL
ncbi:MAG: DUF1449 family protein [Alteromonadaceae bacterium]|nr:DUF1449 family protein [Alteromonadaceae bacterium]